MAVRPVVGPAPVSGDPAHSLLDRWAVGLAAAVAIVVSVSYAIFFIAIAIGGRVDDTWVGYLGGVSLVGGLLVSLVAFALAVVAKVKHERWGLLWLPLSVFPALLAIVVIAEAFWME